MPPSRRRRRSFRSILNNHASIPSAPPILPSYPEPSRRRRRLASCPATTVRIILPLRQWRSPQPSAFGHTLSLLCSRRASSPYYYFLYITLLLTLTHPPRFPVYKLRLGAPYWPPACKSTLRRTFLSFSHSPLIWRFHPHLVILVNIPSPLSSLVQVRVCVRTACNRDVFT